jgi:hypothetical protein
VQKPDSPKFKTDFKPPYEELKRLYTVSPTSRLSKSDVSPVRRLTVQIMQDFKNSQNNSPARFREGSNFTLGGGDQKVQSPSSHTLSPAFFKDVTRESENISLQKEYFRLTLLIICL